MEVTKLEHACLIVREGEFSLVIDPGNFTRPVEIDEVAAVVITHEHPDHVTAEQLRGILRRSPDARVFGPAGVAAALASTAPEVAVDVVGHGATRSVGPFELVFQGSRHQLIHSSVPVIDNTGVSVNGALFYPGDAYTVPAEPVRTLAAPIGAPWLKVAEMMDWVLQLRPERSFPTHTATLSDAGFQMAADRLAEATAPSGSSVVLQPGDTLAL